MSPEAWIGLAALILTALGLITGSAWWMSALYSRVGSIQINTKSTSQKLDTLTDKMDGEMHEVRRDVADLKDRVGKVEGRIESNWGIE